MTNKWSTFLQKLRRDGSLYLMIAPAVLFFILFAYLPMVGVVIAFKSLNYRDGILGSPWVGVDNFKYLFTSGKIAKVVYNTVFFNLIFMIVNTTLQVVTAVLLVEIGSKWFKKIMQSFLFFPFFISWVIVGTFIYNIFNFEHGALNSLLGLIGIPPVDVYDPSLTSIWTWIIVVVNAWKWVGYGSVIYLAAIMGIDNELYEAAEMDGASKLSKIRHITLPLLRPQIVVLSLLAIGNIFRGDFQMFFQVTGNNSLLYSSTDVIDTFVTRALLQSSDFGMSAAAGFMQSIFCFVIIITVNYIVRKTEKEYALF